MYKRLAAAFAVFAVSAEPSAAMKPEICDASWYNLPGQQMANGEIFHSGAEIVAHKSLPLETKVRITNIDPDSRARGATVCGPVKDRGPYIDGRCVDVSKPLAIVLGIIKPGTVKVKVVKVISC